MAGHGASLGESSALAFPSPLPELGASPLSADVDAKAATSKGLAYDCVSSFTSTSSSPRIFFTSVIQESFFDAGSVIRFTCVATSEACGGGPVAPRTGPEVRAKPQARMCSPCQRSYSQLIGRACDANRGGQDTYVH